MPLRRRLAHTGVATIAVALLAVIVYFGTTALGLESVFATLAICVTAPVGAVALDRWASRLLSTESSPDPLRN